MPQPYQGTAQGTVMGNHFPDICIGHLQIVDHLVLGMAAANHASGNDHRPWRLVPVPMNTWDEICDTLANKSIHGAFIPTPLALELFASGMDIRFLMFVHRSGSLMVKTRNAGIDVLADFTGKPVLVPSWFSIQAMLLHKLLGASGMVTGPHAQQGGDVPLETVPPYLMPEILLAEKDMDHDGPATGGYMAPEPFGSLAVSRGLADIVCSSDSLWKNHPCCGFVVTRHFLQSYPGIIKTLVNLFFSAARHLENMPIPNQAALGAGFLAQDPVLVQTALARSKIHFAPEKLVPDTAAIDMMQSYMVDAMGIMPQKIDLDILVDTTWAQNALSEGCIAD